MEDKDFILDIAHQMMEGFGMVARSMGAKVKIPERKRLIDNSPQADPNYVPTVGEVLSRYGGKGTVLRR